MLRMVYTRSIDKIDLSKKNEDNWIFKFADGLHPDIDEITFFFDKTKSKYEAIFILANSMLFRAICMKGLSSDKIPVHIGDWISLIEDLIEQEILITSLY